MEIARNPPAPHELQAIQAECTRYLYVFVRYGQLFTLVGGALIAALLWHQAADDPSIDPAARGSRQMHLVLWVIALGGLVGWQQLCGRAFRRATEDERARPVWRQLLLIELTAVSALWGVLALFMMPGDPMYGVVVLVAIALLTNGALPNFAVDRHVFYGWVGPQLLSLIAAYALQGDAVSHMLAALMTIDLLYQAWVQLDVRRHFVERVLALLRNESLVRQVQGAKVALTASLAEQKAIFDLATVGIAEIRAGRLVRSNPQLASMLGYAESELGDLTTESLLPPGVDGSAFDPAAIARSPGHSFAADLPLRRKDGSALWVQLTSRSVDKADPARGHIAVFSDISDRLEREAVVRRLAYEDALTGLPNRRLLQDRVGVAMSRAQRSGASSALLLIDLDGFKKINDVHGHEAGDLVLKIVAQRLLACVRASDMVCRLGGDEFVVLLEEPIDQRDALQVAQKIITISSQPIVSGAALVGVGASIGIAMAPLSGQDVDTLLRTADEAMYRAKQAGRGTCRMHSADVSLPADRVPG